MRHLCTVFAVFVISATAVDVGAQLVPIRTVPVATGDQFKLYPSSRGGMGGLEIATEDSLAAVFGNPAAGLRLGDGFFFGAPVHFGVSQEWGAPTSSATSLPLGAFFTEGDWAFGGSLALQEVTTADNGFAGPVPLWDRCLECELILLAPSENTLSDASARNVYLGAQAARKVGRGAALGFAVSFADLGGVSGIEHLYAGSQRIDVAGTVLDLRVGALWESESGAVTEAILLHNRVDIRHDVTYVEWGPVPVEPDPLGVPVWEPHLRIDENLDVTHTWGGHVRHARPVGERGWRVGWSATANKRSHPKIPNYEIQNIPRDPGNSWAFNLGLGLGRGFGPVSFGVEAVLEPIWAETWQEAESDTVTSTGSPIDRGDKTILNDFQFANVLLRSGVAIEQGRATFQAGLEAHSLSYDLDQADLLAGTRRAQTESWIEWTPTWGLRIRLDEATLHYTGQALAGTGAPGVAQNWIFDDVPLAGREADSGALGILTAPSGPLTLQAATVWTHQFAVTIPIR